MTTETPRKIAKARRQTVAPGPWLPAEYDDEIVAAVQAWAAGVASERQQQLAFRWVVEVLCATFDMSYRPGAPDDTSFAEGKRSIGNQIVKMTKLRATPKPLGAPPRT